MSNNDLFQKVKKLNLPIGNYAIFGSGSLMIRNIRESRDLDVIVTEDLFEEYKNKLGWKLKDGPSGDKYLWNNRIELWKEWKPGQWDIKQLIREAEIIDGLPFVKLKYILEWKKLSGREKDLKDIETIEKFLQTQK